MHDKKKTDYKIFTLKTNALKSSRFLNFPFNVFKKVILTEICRVFFFNILI